MSDLAIRVENLGKRYRIGQQERHCTLHDTLYYRGVGERLVLLTVKARYGKEFPRGK